MLVDILSCMPPHLNIMDGVIAMEGEGPSAGNLRRVGVILVSSDAVALDAVATKIVGFNPMDVFTTFHAHNRGLGNGRIEDIEIIGERIQEVRVKNFKHSAIAISLFRRKLPSFLYAYFQDQLALIPEVRKEKCTGCLECIEICPVEAAELHEELAWLDKKRCIHCMCCHEVCRDNAIKLKRKLTGRVVRGIFSAWERINSLFS